MGQIVSMMEFICHIGGQMGNLHLHLLFRTHCRCHRLVRSVEPAGRSNLTPHRQPCVVILNKFIRRHWPHRQKVITSIVMLPRPWRHNTSSKAGLLPLSQSRDREKVRSSYRDFGVREMSHGGSSETRHVGEGDLVWLSASSQNDVYQNADSRLPVHGIYPLIHHQSVDNACPSNEITFFETQEPPFAGSSQSTSQHPYTLVQDAQLYTVQHREDQYANDREF
jgi:hypothetical protein